MSGEEYRHWHDGVELVDAESQTWRGYIEDNDYTRKYLTDATFQDKGEAIVAASRMLADARKGNPPAAATSA